MVSKAAQESIEAITTSEDLSDDDKKEIAAGVADSVGGLPRVTSVFWSGLIYFVALAGLVALVFVFGLVAVDRGNDANTGGQDIAIAIATGALGAFIGLFAPSPVTDKK